MDKGKDFKMIRPKYLVFDVGGVILFPKSTIVDAFLDFSKKINLPQNKAIEIFKKYNPKLSTGTIETKDFLQLLLKKTAINFTVKQLVNLWCRSFAIKKEEINKEILDHIKYLGRSYKTCIFSNGINTLSDNKKINKMVRSHFDYVFNSYDIGFKKPDVKAFQYVLNKLQAFPRECVFIDDEEDNVHVAKKLGFKSVRYKNNKKFLSDLEKIGIKI